MTDTGPLTLAYAVGAVALAVVLVAPLLLVAYFDSDTHRRRMARVRRLTERPRQENTTT